MQDKETVLIRVSKEARRQIRIMAAKRDITSQRMVDQLLDIDHERDRVKNTHTEETDIENGVCPKCGGEIYNRSVGDETYAYCEDCSFSTAPL